jgi:hypothetical protein
MGLSDLLEAVARSDTQPEFMAGIDANLLMCLVLCAGIHAALGDFACRGL